MPDTLTAVAMSGGVDSSAVAAMLRQAGERIAGFTMQLWDQRRLPELQTGATTGRCCSLDDVYDARRVAQHLDIPYYVVNFENRFEEQVVKPFVDDYLAGKTPIPCALCNSFVKFDDFLAFAEGIGAGRIATGHYARVRYDSALERWQLLRSADAAKDQTYFLFGLRQEQLARTLFPLGGMTKPEVRALAAGHGVPVAAKNDSQEICFVPNGDYAAFIDSYFREQGREAAPLKGEIVTEGGRVLGEHQGIHHFTVGQRKGLGIAAAEPLYVISTEPANQRVVVGRAESLLQSSMCVEGINWISIPPPAAPLRAQVKIRNKHTAAFAALTPSGDESPEARVLFDEPQRAITPGQAAVFYHGSLVLGGGWIAR